MIKVAVVCAYPAGTNPGMLSVDLAFESIIGSSINPMTVERFCYGRNLDKSGPIRLKYTELHNVAQLEEFDRIVYWGDFLHWRGYAINDWLSRAQGRHADWSDEKLLDQWYELYLLENRPDLQSRAICFGGTFYGLDSRDLVDERYQTALTFLYNNARAVLMRDCWSAHFARQLAPAHNQTFGCDCALLLDSPAITTPQALPEQPYMLYSFGRSGQNQLLEQFAQRLSDHMGLELVNLEWLQKGIGQETLGKKIYLIQHAKFVLTDIYHCAITAWREHCPVLCIGNGASRIESSLSDKKKEIFHAQIFAGENYVFVEEIINPASWNKGLLQKFANLVCNDSTNQIIFGAVLFQAQQAKQNLLKALE